MPELPEVETIRRDLSKKIISKQIISFQVNKKRIIKNSVAKFRKSLLNHHIVKLDRVGKLLILNIDNGLYLLIHLKMTGQLVYYQQGKITPGGHFWPSPDTDLPNRFTHIIFGFNDGSELFFNDMRQFGYLRIVNERELIEVKNKFGIEPIANNYTWEKFKELIKNRRVSIKAFLLNQSLIAGLGNIYVDEACFLAGIRPQKKVNKLTLLEKKEIWQASRKVLQQGIKNRGTTFSDYVDADGNSGYHSKFLKVYGRTGKLCKKCKQVTIRKIKLVGRGTHYCPICQK